MSFGEKMRELLEQGAQSSKELASKAGAKAQDLGERGVLLIEIRKLQGQAKKLIDNLGDEVYQAFIKQRAESVSAEDPNIKKILDEILFTEKTIEEKETELQARKDREATRIESETKGSC